MESMWAAFKRIIKPRGAIVLTATNPFAAELIMSNRDWFKYEWVWEKDNGTNFLDAQRKPMICTESILVFGNTTPNYYPIMRQGTPYISPPSFDSGLYGAYHPIKKVNIGTRYPRNIVKVTTQKGHHPTQKPVALFEYLIRTYTQPGELVFDPCVGSGTTAIAARNCGRQFIVGDMLEEYVQVARERLAKPYTVPMFDNVELEPQPEQITMWSDND